MTSGTDIYNALQAAGATTSRSGGGSHASGADQETKGLFGQYVSEENAKAAAPSKKETKAAPEARNDGASETAEQTTAPAKKTAEGKTAPTENASAEAPKEQAAENPAAKADQAEEVALFNKETGKSKTSPGIASPDQTPTASPEELPDAAVDGVADDAPPEAAGQPGAGLKADAAPEAQTTAEDGKQVAVSDGAASGQENSAEGKQVQAAAASDEKAPQKNAEAPAEQAAQGTTEPETDPAPAKQQAEVSPKAAVDDTDTVIADKEERGTGRASEEKSGPGKQVADTKDSDKESPAEPPVEVADASNDEPAAPLTPASHAEAKKDTSSKPSESDDNEEDLSDVAVAATQAPAEKQVASRAEADSRTGAPTGDETVPVDSSRSGNRQQNSNGQPQDNRENKNLAAAAADNRDGVAKAASGDAAGSSGQTEPTAAKPAGEQFALLQKTPLDSLASKTAAATHNLNMGQQLVVGAHNLVVQEAASTGLQHSGTILQNGLASAQAAADQILAAVSRHMANGKSTFRVQLHPAELGQVDVKMDFAADGKMMTTLTVDNEKTLHLLQRDQHTLSRMLGNAGFNMDQGNLNFNLRQQAGNGNGFGNPDSGFASGDDIQAEDDLAPAEIIAVNVSNSGLDISV
ncbi:flagellar hook-length control protein FliK [Emcibacter nanhaiensis]|uniref:Flagellar hook-length control protein-like C-terminal domain-containing protein n=1 Tax=Emcibacter nanhaiensis TaxID=1505037 RepID=A0A501PP45_9PROT|nr:flagellar hook-length control protein FliK [Emcibacter nanhaiensis]TPD62025.1 hypothetical protein FIV46_07445 [Emcibacter nanhaiensis]